METAGTRREFLQRVGLGAAAWGMAGGPLAVAAASRKAGGGRPNIVVIMADDLGYECLGCYGGASYRTPVLDALAAAGMRFEHCYAQPLCTPSRVKIMTGKSNARNYTRFGALDPAQKTFGQALRQAGYATCIVGKWQLAARDGGEGTYPRAAGFDEHCLWQIDERGSRYRDPIIVENGRKREDLEGQYGPDVFCDYALEFIERKKGTPFFLWYPMTLTHAPFEPTPDTQEWKKGIRKPDRKHFADMVAYMDKIIGRLVAKLDELSLRENTLILFTGDNGTPRGIRSTMKDGSVVAGGKGQTTDAGTHVALVANWKGQIGPGRVCSDIVDFSDILPTIVEAAGGAVDWTIDGHSFLGRLLDRPYSPREWIYVWYRRDPDTPLYRFARDQRWKLYDRDQHERAGKLFDVSTDPLEEHPIDPVRGGEEAVAAAKKLRAVLDVMAPDAGPG